MSFTILSHHKKMASLPSSPPTANPPFNWSQHCLASTHPIKKADASHLLLSSFAFQISLPLRTFSRSSFKFGVLITLHFTTLKNIIPNWRIKLFVLIILYFSILKLYAKQYCLIHKAFNTIYCLIHKTQIR